MGIAANYKKEIISASKELPEDKLRELADFAQFLKAKMEGFTYMQIKEDSVEYVKKIRNKEAIKAKTGKRFIQELIQWQDSNS